MQTTRAMGRIKRIGILTGGGDCPGLNGVIRGVAKSAMHCYQADVYGFYDGFRGLVTGAGRWLSWEDVSGILTLGGTILGTTNRDNPFSFVDDYNNPEKRRDASSDVLENYHKLKLDALVVVGGDGTLQCSHNLSRLGLNIIGIPKTIDNDVRGTDRTFGFDSAVTTATEAIDKIHSTAASHHRVMLVEVMGRTAGWIALTAGVAGGADIILLPEISFRIGTICNQLRDRKRIGRHFTIVVVSEGARAIGENVVIRNRVRGSHEQIRLGGVSAVLAKQIEDQSGLETRSTILGYLQRGGSPTPFDRFLATRFATAAVDYIAEEKFNCMVSLRGDRITSVPLSVPSVAPKHIPKRSRLITMAREIGTKFGDEQ